MAGRRIHRGSTPEDKQVELLRQRVTNYNKDYWESMQDTYGNAEVHDWIQDDALRSQGAAAEERADRDQIKITHSYIQCKWSVMPFTYASEWTEQAGWHPHGRNHEYFEYFMNLIMNISRFPLGVIGQLRCYIVYRSLRIKLWNLNLTDKNPTAVTWDDIIQVLAEQSTAQY